ncbi:hypothetical protein LDG_6918 [Legionella drancourtii LLAP12]|uniref:Uncharacterized protein n=1 Tax=Legionella drancourtii LLAP12 TaxID=658187 RepID=G9ENU0_9GAMM|nr:hypothetical protein LDG_6918 [Legionella drancourtii LLAP12]
MNDWQYVQNTQKENTTQIEQQIEKGEWLFFSTGHDETFNVQVA